MDAYGDDYGTRIEHKTPRTADSTFRRSRSPAVRLALADKVRQAFLPIHAQKLIAIVVGSRVFNQ